jgi:hypothetical protein
MKAIVMGYRERSTGLIEQIFVLYSFLFFVGQSLIA